MDSFLENIVEPLCIKMRFQEESGNMSSTFIFAETSESRLVWLDVTTDIKFETWLKAVNDDAKIKKKVKELMGSVSSLKFNVFGAMTPSVLPWTKELNKLNNVDIALYLFGSTQRRSVVLDRSARFNHAGHWGTKIDIDDLPELK
mmetsp:Transcript_5092/g.9365  ORF Transcript_5092/g.9365 Transcript_5092/m.9365 type:complete len:145 (+) Transcript_5092:853-1287(+)|eukprot:CAMPEP_0197518136 /NCGR_PEP_ID=MMETSP1318-20131121/3266_1 /TAXON_ID=552666 /ORGANISM="Partenskyella glossopodia, Strain RCC365" /LENGTH=144 /DNA_ID=CAMNT_0043068241 /DNA_START=759 /DNA_END=1193 /DNA_ORIENTATION=-